MLIVVSWTLVALSVTVSTAVRAAPVLGSTVKSMLPSPDPDVPAVILRNAALLTPPQVQLAEVLIETDDEPPPAGNVVVGFPVMTWQPPTEDPDDPAEEPPGDSGLPPQAMATSSRTAAEATRARRER